MKAKKVVLSFSYNGSHLKSGGWGGPSKISPVEHMQMLIAAIDCINPNKEHDVIVSALNLNLWSMKQEEKEYVMEIHKKSRFVFDFPHTASHHAGAGIAINMSLYGAVTLNADYMIHLAEDVIMRPDAIDYFCEYLKNNDYVGTTWPIAGREHEFFNTQVFGCKPKIFYQKKIVPGNAKALEYEFCKNIKSNKLKYAIGKKPFLFPEEKTLYFHTHDPKVFKKNIEKLGVKWFRIPEKKFL